jgi:adducin
VSYHEYHGRLVDAAEKDLIIRNLGPFNKVRGIKRPSLFCFFYTCENQFNSCSFSLQVMFLRNHGVVCCGESVEEAFLNTYYTILACETQVRCQSYCLSMFPSVEKVPK